MSTSNDARLVGIDNVAAAPHYAASGIDVLQDEESSASRLQGATASGDDLKDEIENVNRLPDEMVNHGLQGATACCDGLRDEMVSIDRSQGAKAKNVSRIQGATARHYAMPTYEVEDVPAVMSTNVVVSDMENLVHNEERHVGVNLLECDNNMYTNVDMRNDKEVLIQELQRLIDGKQTAELFYSIMSKIQILHRRHNEALDRMGSMSRMMRKLRRSGWVTGTVLCVASFGFSALAYYLFGYHWRVMF